MSFLLLLKCEECGEEIIRAEGFSRNSNSPLLYSQMGEHKCKTEKIEPLSRHASLLDVCFAVKQIQEILNKAIEEERL